jgi:hypothetical protein
VKFKGGDTRLWEIVEFVLTAALGFERGVDLVVTKSPEGDLLVVVVQPGGRGGGVTESKFSM